LEFPEGWGHLGENPFHGGGMGIFWNYTIKQINKLKDKMLKYKSVGHIYID